MTSEGHHEATERPLRCPLRCLWQEGNLVLRCSQRDEVGKTRDTQTRERAPDRLSWGGGWVGEVVKRPDLHAKWRGAVSVRSASPSPHTVRWPQGPEAASWRRAHPEGSPRHSLLWRAARIRALHSSRSRRGRGLLPNARPAPGGLSRRAPRTQAGPGRGKRYFTMKKKIKELLEILKHNYENRIP